MSDRNPRRATPSLAACAAALSVLLLWPSAAGADAALRDPTRPPLRPDAPAADRKVDSRAPLDLSAVFVAKGKRAAIVNAERVGVGDVIQGARIVAIERGRVVLVREGARIELELVDDVKRPASRDASATPTADASNAPPPNRREKSREPTATREGSPS